MNFLKKLPIDFKGELHEVVLINFSVDPTELEGKLPSNIPIRLVNGRALISAVNVSLKHMRPVFIPGSLGFNYQHVAFRLLVDDIRFTGKASKGIFFLQSFTTNPFIIAGGKALTNYRLSKGGFTKRTNQFEVVKDSKYFRYELGGLVAASPQQEATRQVVAKIDRAYSAFGNEVRVTRVLREKWPLEPVECRSFETNFFNTARLEAAFKVPCVIHYTWLSPQIPKKCAS